MAPRADRQDRVQGYLAHTKTSSPMTLKGGLYLWSYGGPRGGGLFLMSEVPLYGSKRRLARSGISR